MGEESPCQMQSSTPQRGGTSTVWSQNSKVFLVLEGRLSTQTNEITFGILSADDELCGMGDGRTCDGLYSGGSEVASCAPCPGVVDVSSGHVDGSQCFL